MDILLKRKIDLMVKNFNCIKEEFKLEKNLSKYFIAMIHASKGKTVNIDGIKEIKKYIQSETNLASQFRGSNEFIISNFLCFEDEYEAFFKNMLVIYEKLQDIGFKNSTYLPLAAYIIAKESSSREWDLKISRMDEFYKSMKRNHFWLTSTDDYAFAATLAVSNLSEKETSEDIEECYKRLSKACFSKGNHLQTFCNILAFGEETVEEKCDKAIKLYHELVENKCKLKQEGLATLGVLTLVVDDIKETVVQIKDAYDYIYNQEGYGFWSINKATRTILASSLVCSFYVDGIKEGILQTTLGNSINSILAAEQQAAIVAACVATTSITSSVASSS